MSEVLNISLTLPDMDDFDLEDLNMLISETVMDNESEFMERMARICTQSDMRADFSEGTLEVEDIEFYQSIECMNIKKINVNGHINVHFDWYAHYGCKDMNGGDESQDKWLFNLSGGCLLFNLQLPQQRYDEI